MKFRLIPYGYIYFTLLGVILMFSCTDEGGQPEINAVTEISNIRFSETSSSGFEGGVTTYSSANNNLQSRNQNSEFFISQYPLAEYRRIYEVEYDSVVTIEVDSVTRDTLSVNIDVVELSREFTGEVVKGNLWAPYEQYYVSELFVGIPSQVLDTVQKIEIAANVTDSLADEPATGGISISLHNPDIDQSYFLFDSPFEMDSSLYVRSDEVPFYDDNGEVEGYTSGIILPLFRLYHQSDDVSKPLTRMFTIEIRLGDTSFSSDFSIFFVSAEEWGDRNCWLAQVPECRDFFDE
ncbi:hypothetical protein [Flagellimonas meridianipacifica]|uniref:Uncharacterized protein n=1 Tax=Flagellimonas meridianipacifica TaxID=1080225 RepID=A0A2T0MD16_9FLAO|nr:hypothetical protein [Allomuricauda pacifica]PRX55390.1 hypothetical protein CLV81_3802 [Allomuricauda pacifica]